MRESNPVNQKLLENRTGVDTLTILDRIAVRTNTVDWMLLIPNIGAEFDVKPVNWNRWTVGFNVRGNPQTSHTFTHGVVFNMFEARVEARQYWRARQINRAPNARLKDQPHKHIWDKAISIRRSRVKHQLLSSMVAYGLAKYEFKGKNVIFMCVLMVMMVPLEILMLPMYTQVNAMGMRNTYAGVMLPFLVSMSAVFFFRQFLTGIPYEMIEAARVDGCTEYGIFFRIIMPVMKPAYASMAVLTGMGAWNALLWPMLVLSDMKKYTIPIGLNTLWSPYGNNYDLMITGSCFAILPLLLIYLFAQKFIVEGMTAGAVKG